MSRLIDDLAAHEGAQAIVKAVLETLDDHEGFGEWWADIRTEDQAAIQQAVTIVIAERLP